MEDTSNQDFNKTNQSTIGKQRSKKLLTPCKICGAPAFHLYVGVIVCPSCKIFFRRNAQMKRDHSKCCYDGHCEININNRHVCTFCRLAKCFASGMQADMLRAARTATKPTDHKEKSTTISTVASTRKEKDQSQQFPTLNLLRTDQSILSIDEWNLLSKLTHCYDEYSRFTLAQRFIQEQNELPPKMRFKIASVAQLFASLLGHGQLVYEKNSDFISLCSHDRSILLRNTMKYVASLGLCLIGRYTGLFCNPTLCESAEAIYGSSTLAIGHRTVELLDSDGTLVKLVLALLSFSTFNYVYYTSHTPVNLLNINAVLCIQDRYTELIWRYLLNKYDHNRAVICFSNLIKCLFSLNDILVKAVEHKEYTDLIDSLIRRTEETFILTE